VDGSVANGKKHAVEIDATSFPHPHPPIQFIDLIGPLI
jgi:hypothetical protein